MPVDFSISLDIDFLKVFFSENVKFYFLHVNDLEMVDHDYVKESSENEFKKLIEPFSKLSIPYESEVIDKKESTVSKTILVKAKELGVDMVLINSHGHGVFYEAIVGSVTHDVLKESNIPVLIMPDTRK